MIDHLLQTPEAPKPDRDRADLLEAVRLVLSIPAGRTVLFWVMEQAGVYRDAFTGDRAATDYILGQQAIGRKLIGLMEEIDPRTYPRLLLEIADQQALKLAVMANEEEDDDEA